MKTSYLIFKWASSNKNNVYGYKTCSLYVNGKKVISTNGVGYDMAGTCFGKWLENQFQSELKNLDETSYSGISKNNDVVHLDGRAGFDKMVKIANAIGYNMFRADNGSRKQEFYIFSK